MIFCDVDAVHRDDDDCDGGIIVSIASDASEAGRDGVGGDGDAARKCWYT